MKAGQKAVELKEFRRHMGAAAEGMSEAELAQIHAALQWIADQAIAFALRHPSRPLEGLQRTA